jgi:hypothetical protein
MADVTSPFAFPYPEDTDLVRDGATDIENLAEGVNDYLAGGYLYAGTRYYTSSGTFLKADAFGDSSNVVPRAIRVRMVGGGGGGGGTDTTGSNEVAIGTGGSGAAYAESFITDIAGLDATVTVTRGAGGAAGAAGSNNGGSGGQSAFGALVTANGGGGGFGAAGQTIPFWFDAVSGATTATGDLVLRGSMSSPAYGIQANRATSAPAGASQLGLPGAAQATGVSAAGITETAFGAGGGGAVAAQSQGTSRAGGAGGPGLIIVDVFV